ncbi:MAG: aldehyde ferredoxin oxidoreductase C-terminal domain-containing protein [Candidatus Aminicenantales bacterium]
MSPSENGLSGYMGRWAFVDLTGRTVRIEPADPAVCRDYVGGRGVQARLIYDRLHSVGPLRDPLSLENRIVIGAAAPNDTFIPTAGRGSCSFVSPMTRSPEPAAWVPGHKPLYGLLTHSSAGGLFPNMLKRTGIDQLIIDGRADRPVRILVTEDSVLIIEAEDDLFETVDGRRMVRPASAITDFLTAKYPGSSTMCLGPAGWNGVAFACLTGDHHRNFGRGGAGAVFGSKNLVAVTALGRRQTTYANPDAFQKLSKELDALIKAHVADPEWTASFRPRTGTTWWLDRAFNGRYLGKQGGYLPWHNFDEGWFDPGLYSKVGTDAFLAIAGKHKVCNRCRHVMCTRSARVESGPYAGEGVRPEFETIALWINCCITDREAIFHLNRLCNEQGVDTMSFGSVTAGAMDLEEKGFLEKYAGAPKFGDAPSMIRFLEDIAYLRSDTGRVFSRHSDAVIAEVGGGATAAGLEAIARCVLTAYGGLGYAGIEPKAFPGMFTAYGTSNRGRGDHTYAWTIQAEEGGLEGADKLAAYVAGGQVGKALVDSLGLCDFFPESVTSDLFLGLYRALTGIDYTAESMNACGERIYNLERRFNNIQGRDRAYDAYVPAKLTVPLTAGAHKGKAVDLEYYRQILDAYYAHYGWTADGLVPPEKIKGFS